jgi:hypothetical protein
MIRGTIRRRLLINARVDPDEAVARLPVPLRPHVTGDGTVVGCCLLDIERVRPAGVPAAWGFGFRAAALRISVEWDDASGRTAVGVYVPMRFADSRAATAAGGRWFPGVHPYARIGMDDEGDRLRWSVAVGGMGGGSGERVVGVEGSVAASLAAELCDPVGVTCLEAALGISPDHRRALGAVRMEPEHRHARRFNVETLECEFLASFSSASPAPSYLMRDVGVTWRTEPVPQLSPVKALR